MTDNLELQMDAYLPLRDVVFQTLRGAILKGDLKPGERLMELMAQNLKMPTLEDLLPGGATYRIAENLPGLQWWGRRNALYRYGCFAR